MLLDRAFAEVAKFPQDEQDALAVLIIGMLRTARHSDRSQTHVQGRLDHPTDGGEPVFAIHSAIGRREALLESITAAIDIRFGMLGRILLPEIERIAAPKRLNEILCFIMTASSPADVRAAFPDVDYPGRKRVRLED